MWRAFWLSALTAWLPLPARAQPVTVDFVQVHIEEALAELERQAGVRIYRHFDDAIEQPLIDLQARDVPFRTVLRAICQQVDCYFPPAIQYFEIKPRPDPLETCPVAQVGPYTIRLLGIDVVHSWTWDFESTDADPLAVAHQMRLTLRIEADQPKDLEAVLDLHPAVRAVADTGETVEPKQRELPEHPLLERPDVRWGYVQDSVKLAAPGPDAASLMTLEGDIVVRKDAKVHLLEFPLAGGPASQSAADHTITVTSIQPVADGGYDVRTEWHVSGRDPYYEGYFVTAAGGRVNPRTLRPRRARGQDGQALRRCDWQFRPAAELVPTAFVFEFVTTGDETETVHYRFEGIPLPTWEE